LAEDYKARRLVYLEKMTEAEEKAARATDQSTIDGWNLVAEGYRTLLQRLIGNSSVDLKPK
jgi:hypothetical protein